jgi:anaerobic carbon-monoxide dehydrogenase iron sulfur subunit
MERNVLSFDPHLCTGCMQCMTACATYHEGRTSLSKARLQIIRHEGHALTAMDEEDELIFTFVGCQQCEEPVCSLVCPVAAIGRDSATGAITIDRDKCVGCRACLMTCYFGAISFNKREKTVFKCDLCGGDPQCVRFCYAGALKFVPVERVPLIKKMKTAKKTMIGSLDRSEP